MFGALQATGLYCESSHRQHKNRWIWLCSNKIYFKKQAGRLDLAREPLFANLWSRIPLCWKNTSSIIFFFFHTFLSQKFPWNTVPVVKRAVLNIFRQRKCTHPNKGCISLGSNWTFVVIYLRTTLRFTTALFKEHLPTVVTGLKMTDA